MASLSQFLLPPRWNSKFVFSSSVCIVQIPHYKVSKGLSFQLSSKRKVSVSVAQDEPVDGVTSKRKPTSRGRKKASEVNEENSSELAEESDEKPERRTRKKATSASVEEKDEKIEKKTRGRKKKSDVEVKLVSVNEDDTEKKPRGRKPKKKINNMDEQGTGADNSDAEISINNEDEDDVGSKTEKKTRGRKSKKKVDLATASDVEASDIEVSLYITDEDNEDDLDLELAKHEDEDCHFECYFDTSLYIVPPPSNLTFTTHLKQQTMSTSSTRKWPPLVCCFGAAQHAFVPSGRPSNRLIDYDIHERKKDAFWKPEKYMRAPGGSPGSVAIALASLGGKVALMGKLGDDQYGQAMLWYLNASNVETRAVCIDSRRQTAVTKMKIAKRGGLRMTMVKHCAEDSLTRNEVNIDLLKEASMFYLCTHSLLDQNMRKSTLRALKIAKKLGCTIFYDLNLPLPLWKSYDETISLILQVWDMADIIEVTKQELEFLCGITPSENFDTKDNHPSKFKHYDPEVIAPLWHENLKVLFVTNGTSRIHYYTKEQDGSVLGMEDAPITPYTSDMSASGDGIVAALMRMLVVQPHLMTDKEYIEHSIKYAIDCGVIDQWILGRQRGYPSFEDEDEDVEPDEHGITSLTEREFRTVARVS
ncbi:uncharacterized protein [Phyllobates terribilis]|uniref:uncharacterized protein n=1 Tax=Phyllobates terribilis TaxID=111132 RepID=UPI003CCA7CDA